MRVSLVIGKEWLVTKIDQNKSDEGKCGICLENILKLKLKLQYFGHLM